MNERTDWTTFYANLPSIFAADLQQRKVYQPIFGSFFLTYSDPFNQAVFVQSKSMASDSFDEDDFDGIPLKSSRALSNETLARSRFVEMNLPSIDDPDPLDDESKKSSADSMDWLEHSNSMDSSSLDSLLSLSSSNSERISEWTDDRIFDDIRKCSVRSKPIITDSSVDAPVSFIDRSVSSSQCSSALSFGYADQARLFLGHDELMTSTDNESQSDSADDFHLPLDDVESLDEIDNDPTMATFITIVDGEMDEWSSSEHARRVRHIALDKMTLH
jgi:hypothetical protein